MIPRAKKYQRLLVSHQKPEEIPARRRTQACRYLDLGLLASRTVREYILLCKPLGLGFYVTAVPANYHRQFAVAFLDEAGFVHFVLLAHSEMGTMTTPLRDQETEVQGASEVSEPASSKARLGTWTGWYGSRHSSPSSILLPVKFPASMFPSGPVTLTQHSCPSSVPVG